MVPYTCWLAKSAISAPKLSVVLSDGWDCHILAPLYNWANKWSPVKAVQANCWSSHILVPIQVALWKNAVFALFCHLATKWSTIQAEWWKVQFLVLISQWSSKWHPYKADYLLTVWPYFCSGYEMGNLSFNIGGGLNGPLPFAGSL